MLLFERSEKLKMKSEQSELDNLNVVKVVGWKALSFLL